MTCELVTRDIFRHPAFWARLTRSGSDLQVGSRTIDGIPQVTVDLQGLRRPIVARPSRPTPVRMAGPA
jgi:hypothetical protein